MDNSKIFNRALYRSRRLRAADAWKRHDFLKREAAERLAECLADMTRAFPLALDLGCHQGDFGQIIGSRGGIKTLIQCDHAEKVVRGAEGVRLVSDEEFLPFAPNIFDLVVSVLSLHHVNDLPGTLIQIHGCLKPDGLFLAVLPGASTLTELRKSITHVSAEHGFALSPRLSPLIEVRDAGALLQRAGFALPVVDSDMLTVEYDNILKLMHDLRGMGESNVLLERQKNFTTRTQLAAIADYYQTHFGRADGTIPASFEFITMTGWKPHTSQQQPAKRGSGKVNLKQILEKN